MPNLGRKATPSTLMGEPDRVAYPSLHLSGDQVDALGLWPFDVGDDTMMHAKVRISSKTQDAGEDRRVTLEVMDATVDAKKGIDANRMFPTTVSAMPGRITK